MEYFRYEIPKANANINKRKPHSLETAVYKNMKQENMSVNLIARFTGLSVEEIEKL
jgi:hypothetical protein